MREATHETVSRLRATGQLDPRWFDMDAGIKRPAWELGKGRRYDLWVQGYGNGGYIASWKRQAGHTWYAYVVKFDMGRVTVRVDRLDDDDQWRTVHAWMIDRDGTGSAVPAADWWKL